MENITTWPGERTRALVLFMALGFVLMLFVALAGNFKNSQLTQWTPEPVTGMPASMDRNIGRLMRQVAKEPDNKNLDLLVQLAEALMAAQNWDAAEIFAKRGVTLNTQDQRSLYLLGVILHNKGQHKEAAEAIEKAIAVKSTAPLHYSLAVLNTYFLKHPQHGMEHFTIALNAPDADEELRQAIRQELNKQALPGQNTAQGEKTPAPQATIQNSQPLSHELTQKITSLEKATLRNPNDSAAWMHLGNLYFDTGKAKEAIPAYERSLELAPDNPDVLTDLGIMHRDAGNFAKAIDCFNKAVSLNPKHQNAFFNMGVVFYYDLHQREDAVYAWRRLLKTNPGALAPDGQPVSELITHLH